MMMETAVYTREFLFVQEKAEMRRFEELNQGYIAQNIRLVRVQGLFQPLLEALIRSGSPRSAATTGLAPSRATSAITSVPGGLA